MKKPYIICHMMISIDGRIDCAMTSKLRGVNDYYTTLDEISLLGMGFIIETITPIYILYMNR